MVPNEYQIKSDSSESYGYSAARSVYFAGHVLAQTAPASPDHPWHFPGERQMEDDAKHFRQSRLSIEPDRTYSLAELVEFRGAQQSGDARGMGRS